MADTALSRMVGLLNQKTIGEDEALVITQCRSIHMFFMRFAIDVIFLDRQKRVVGLVKGIRPFRISPYFFKAFYAVEGAPGMIAGSGTQVGDILDFIEKE